MKQKTYRMMTLAMSGFIYLTTTARPVNDSTSVDSTKWFNKTHQLGEVTVKSTLPKIRTNADGMKITIKLLVVLKNLAVKSFNLLIKKIHSVNELF